MSTATCYFAKAIYYSTIDSLYKTRNLLDSAYLFGQNNYLYSIYSSRDAIQGIINKKITPQIVFPINNSILENKPFSLLWRKSSYASKYHVQVSDNNLFNNSLIDAAITDTTLFLNSLENNKTYYCRVSSENKYETSPWSVTVKFSTEDLSLILTPSSQDVSYSSGTTSFTVTSNISWTATSNQGWCTVTPSGNGNGTITANYQANTGANARAAIITVSGSGVINRTVTITQSILNGVTDINHGISKVYPNPTTGLLNIEFESNLKDIITIQVFSNLGNIIQEKKNVYLDGTKVEPIDLHNQTKGVYFIKIFGSKVLFTSMIIVN